MSFENPLKGAPKESRQLPDDYFSKEETWSGLYFEIDRAIKEKGDIVENKKIYKFNKLRDLIETLKRSGGRLTDEDLSVIPEVGGLREAVKRLIQKWPVA